MAETIQEFAARCEFYLNRREARERAVKIGGRVRDLGRMANGSYGLYRLGCRTIRVWAVEITRHTRREGHD